MKKHLLAVLFLITSLFANILVANENDAYVEETFVSESSVGPAQGPITLLIDKKYSPVVGAGIFISTVHLYQALDDSLIPSTEGCTDWTYMLGRFGKYALEGVLFSTGMVAQHEVFGHGWRAREFGVKVRRYQIKPFSGATYLGHKFFHVPPTEKIAITTGGVEATYILAQQIRNRWLETKCMDEREAHFYLLNVFDQTRYVMGTHRRDLKIRHYEVNKDSHDIHSYIKQLNRWHGETVMTPHKLRRKILFDYLDPYAIYSIFAFGNYVITGAQGFEYPMIPIGCYHYLPGFRIALAPYGPEYQFINYIRGMNNQTIQATIRYGDTHETESFGVTLNVTKLFTSDLLDFDGRLDFWHQPRLYARTAEKADGRPGAALSIIGRYRVGSTLEFIGQLGYKSRGYMPGEALNHGPILRAGLSIRL